MKQEANEILKLILKYKLLYFSINEMRELTWINMDKLEDILMQLVKENIIHPIKWTNWVYTTKLRNYQFEDYLKLAQIIRPNSVIWYETALYYHGIISTKPIVIKSVQNMDTKPNQVEFQNHYYVYWTQPNNLYNLWIVEKNWLKIYEAEKAYLDYVMKDIKTPFDYCWMWSTIKIWRLNKKKLLRYFKQGNYPKEYEKILIGQFEK